MAIRVVLQFPPKLSSNNLVIFEFLYGIWILLLFKSVRDAITLPKAESEVLIFLHSSNLAPVAPVKLALSLPAKSTKLSFPTLIFLVILL